jgi:hypothetical protein
MIRRFGQELTNVPCEPNPASKEKGGTVREMDYDMQALVFCLGKEAPPCEQQMIEGGLRRVMVEWMQERQFELGLGNESLFSAVTILDRLLALQARDLDSLARLASTCLFSASKLQEVYNMPCLAQFLDHHEPTPASAILELESQIFSELNFMVHHWTSLQFLQFAVARLKLPGLVKTCSELLLKAFVLEQEYSRCKGSAAASGAIQLTMQLLSVPNRARKTESVCDLLGTGRKESTRVSKLILLSLLRLPEDSRLVQALPEQVKHHRS